MVHTQRYNACFMPQHDVTTLSSVLVHSSELKVNSAASFVETFDRSCHLWIKAAHHTGTLCC